MTRSRIIFYSIFGAYQLLAFVFTIVMENSASFLFKLVGYVGWFKYLTLLGFLLVVADFIWLWMDSRKYTKMEESHRHENNILKAKVYDLQEGMKPKEEAPKTNKAV
jgi:hypothetical protein